MAGLAGQVSIQRPPTGSVASPALDGSGAALRKRWFRARDAGGALPRASEPIWTGLAGARDDDVLKVAAPVLEMFAAELAPSGHVLSFFDAGGWMLWMGGCAWKVARLAEQWFRPAERCQDRAAPASGPGAAPGVPGTVDDIGPDDLTCADGWIMSVASIAGSRSPAPVAYVHVAAPAWPRRSPDAVGAHAIACAIEERLHGAVTLRDQVVEYAVRAAAGPQEAVFAVDGVGRVIAANEAARRRLAFDRLHVPAPVRDRLVPLLVAPAGTAGRALDAPACELEIDWPGGTGRVKLLASLIRYREQLLGAVVRATPAAPSGHAPRTVDGAAPLARYGFEQILGDSDAMREAITLARTAARNDLPVVLLGESGTGKELFAHAIHAASARRTGPLIAVNCGGIPGSLLEAELFGYEAGTFTGGRRRGNAGKFEEADGGTIFLDEIGELPPQAQAALLRVLQEREVVRLGGSAPRRVDIRVVAATNKSLEVEMGAGRFRPDLYFRLNVLSIPVPPLREHREDVRPLASAFLREAEPEVGRSGLALSPAAVAALEAYAWPGNVRELRNVILRGAAVAAGDVIELRDLPDELRTGRPEAKPVQAPPARAARDEPRPCTREDVLTALAASSWNVSRAARDLRISRMTLYRWFRKHHIER